MKETNYVLLGAIGLGVYTLIKYPVVGFSALAAYALFFKSNAFAMSLENRDMSVVEPNEDVKGRNVQTEQQNKPQSINFKFYDSYNKSEFNLEEQVL
jgi:hypothetical protein